MTEDYTHVKESGVQPSSKWDGGCFWPGVGVILGVLALGLFFVIGSLTRIYRIDTDTKPEMTIIPAATNTPMNVPTPTQIPGQNQVSTPSPSNLSGSDFSVGDIVEISGTDGQGLSLRHEPGLSALVDGYGMDNEIFELKGGPIEADGYFWWFLVSPYDDSKKGWAVGAFLHKSIP
jgi:hypothetical protein